MTILKPKYRFASIVLLTVILSHITLFHFEMEKKVLCVGEGEHSHIENIEKFYNTNNIFPSLNNFNDILTDNCTDFQLDIHIDQNIKNSSIKLFTVFNNSVKTYLNQLIENKKFNLLENKDIYSNNTALESLSTIALII